MFQENPNNFLRLQCLNPFRSIYMYVDSADYPADQIFINRSIPMKIIAEYTNPKNDKYVAIICKYPKRCEPGFLEAMSELKRLLLIKGYTDYPDFCDNLKKELQDGREFTRVNR